MTPADSQASVMRPDLVPGSEPRRIVLLTRNSIRPIMRTLLQGLLPDWIVLEVDVGNLDAAQLDPFDVVLLDVEQVPQNLVGDQLLKKASLPVCLLVGDDSGLLTRWLEQGMAHWLPCDLALRRPSLLAAVLRRTARESDLQRQLQSANAALADSRRQVDQLVNRLWDAVPSEVGMGWFTYRHMLERLHEEVERVKRYGGALSVLLGESQFQPESGEEGQIASWTVKQIRRWKRRSDVAGQYGPHGFMLLLPRTPESGALDCSRRLQTVLEQPGGPLRGPLNVYFGVAGVESEAELTVKGLLRQAEERLEQARRARPAPAT